MTELEEGAGRASGLGGPLLAVGAFAAGAAATLLAKRVLDARRDGGKVTDALSVNGDQESNDDIATVLRRAAYDVAVAASGRAADRLKSPDQQEEPEAAESSSR